MGLNKALVSALDMDVTTLLFVDKKDQTIIAYCSFCCSSIKVGDSQVVPAIEIKSFAVDKNYQDLILEDMPGKHGLCAAYIFAFCVKHLRELSAEHIYARYIILYAQPLGRVKRFYIMNSFSEFKAGFNTFRIAGESNRDGFSMYLDLAESTV
jgi:hypothetical protein